jgi:hypothetical protein
VPAPALPLPRPTLAPPPDVTPQTRLTSEERYWTHRDETGQAVSFEGKRANTIQVAPRTTLSILQHFVMAVEADHPGNANTRTTATWRLERAVNAVDVRARTITTLHDVHIEAEIDLDGYPYARRSWHKMRS